MAETPHLALGSRLLHLGSRLLRQWRTEKGLTQPEAAALLGMNFVQVSRFERGAHPGLDTALRIARVTDGAVPVESWAAEDSAKHAS